MPDGGDEETPGYWAVPLHDLRAKATAGPRADEEPRRSLRTAYRRSEAVRVYVLRRANGLCEGCGAPAPFAGRDGRPYLEPHHTRRLSDGGPDDPAHVIGLCPTCHRRAHYASDGETFNAELVRKLPLLEKGAIR